MLLILSLICTGCADNSKVSLQNIMEDVDENLCRRIAALDLAVIAPSSGLSMQDIARMKVLANKYNINIPANVLIDKNLMGEMVSDTNKSKKLMEAINSDHKIIWAIRGGYGAAMLIDYLNKLPIPGENKTIVGFSDITSLNLFISQKWKNWKVIHSHTLARLLDRSYANETFRTLLDILENKIEKYDINKMLPLNKRAETSKLIVGQLTGGNLSIIETSLKTCWEIETKNKIIFLEDTNVTPERIYRSLYHLKESNKLSNIKAVIFGYFHNSNQRKLHKYLREFAKTLDVPVFMTDLFGHGDNNMPLIYNATSEISNNRLTIFTGVRKSSRR
ncbi:MAG: LD-carboxypeptidase [Holosporaceae bacterium]|jgi:muramoyltetrapeptide carboxypeptidase|nr:LD-carboxypeptidase [Holosporaceae bacterium]